MFGSEKHLGRNRPGRSPRDGHWVDSPAGYWDSRNHYQAGYPEGTGHPRIGSTIANAAAKIDRLTYRDQRRAVNYSSRALYRPFTRRRSPDDGDDTYSVHRRTVMERDNSYLRSRGRSRICQEGFRRGPREEYHGPMTDDPTSASIRPPHYSARRECSFSPVPSRGASFSRSHGKSRSRSRTRSPITFNLRKERNTGVRILSRSPDFRSEARMERIRRTHFQKSNFAADDEDVFISPPRSHFSLECDSRWIDNPNHVSARFRERNSPGRFFVKRQKFDSGGSGRMKSADCFRSMMHPGRFTELSGGVGGENKYDGNDSERTKYRDKYEMIHRMGQSNSSGFVRRFRYNGKDYFEVHNTRNEDSCIRATDRRVMPRSAREERAPFKCSSGRIYASVPKSSGIRDYDEDVSR